MYIYITFKPCFVVEWVDNWGNSGMQLNNYFCWGNHRIFNGGKNPQIGICCQQNLGFIQGKIGISSLKKALVEGNTCRKERNHGFIIVKYVVSCKDSLQHVFFNIQSIQ